MTSKHRLKGTWEFLKRRTTKGLVTTSLISALVIIVSGFISVSMRSSGIENDFFAVIYIVVTTLATSVFAACVVSFMFDLKSIRDLIVKNDADLLLKMLLKSDELFSTTGDNSGEHKAILENIRMKSTAALNGICLDAEPFIESSVGLRKGHVEACLASLDRELDRAYAKYVNINRRVSSAAEGVFKVVETMYVRYMNDTELPKRINGWNFLSSGVLPLSFEHCDKNTLHETIEITVNDDIPKLYEYSYDCNDAWIDGIDAKTRRWENQWEEELRNTCVPPNGTCVMTITRTFYIPAKEEISHRWDSVRAESKYEICYEGDDCQPIIHVINCDKCNSTLTKTCTECFNHEDCNISNDGNTKVAVLKNWPNPGIQIKVEWI